jgi:hypothetical protein
MPHKEKTVPRGYEAKRPVGRDSHSMSEKQVKTSQAGTQSHSTHGGKKKDR